MIATAASAAALMMASGGADGVPPLPPSALAHAQAEALIETLNGRLLASNSATATLADWCAVHGLAADPHIRATLDRSEYRAPTDEQRARLQIGPDEPVGYRHVALMCGERTLSIAENWFVPGRLPADTVKLLAETDTPFGTAIRSMSPSRRTISAERLWRPLPEGWESPQHAPRSATDQPASAACEPVPAELIRHRALVLDAQGMPLAEVAETYQRAMLDFPLPWASAAADSCPAG